MSAKNGILEIEEMGHVVGLVEKAAIKAADVRNCHMVQMDGSVVVDPDHQGDDSVTKYINPSKLIERMVTNGWKVLTVAYVRNDGSTNFGHEPAVNYGLQVVLVKV